MPGADPLDLRGFLEKSTAKTTLDDLQRRGVSKVRVLDQRTLEMLIQDAVQKVLSGRAGLLTEEERQRIYQDSRRELDRLLREFNSMKKQHEAASTDRETLLRELENLQKQLQVTRTMYEEKLRAAESKGGGGADPDQLHQMAEQLRQMQTKLASSKEQNQYLEARGKELERKLSESSGAEPAQIKEAFDQGVRSQERYIGELKERVSSIQQELVQARQVQQTAVGGAALEQLAARDDAMADRISKLFNRTIEGINRKIASIKAGAGMVDEVDYRPSEQVLENLLKEEIQSNLGTVVSDQKVSSQKMDDRLAKLKGLQASFKPKKDEEEKQEGK